MDHKTLTAALLGIALGSAGASMAFGGETPNPLIPSASWDALQFDVTGEAPISAANGAFTVEAPYRADDAAHVPFQITQSTAQPILAATVVIDENPSPVAAEFTFGEAMWPLDLQMHLRVNQYSNVRVIAETPTGLHMDGRFVKASGGCSAPAAGDPEKALAEAGGMTLHQTGGVEALKAKLSAQTTSQPTRRIAEIQMQHPNHSGLQRDQITQLFIPAQFVDHMEVWQGEERLFTMDGGISISENPTFRFAYTDNGAPVLTVKATDTSGRSFEQELPKVGG